MTGSMSVPIAGVCPNCESPDVAVPEDFDPKTIVVCRACGHRAEHAAFFASSEA
jgi:Zn ribbon nucleic-acid-binding protein